MFDDMLALLSGMDDQPSEKIVHAAFGWPGGKSRSYKNIQPLLPVLTTFLDVCGGSGIMTLTRPRSKFEVFNDRHAGLTAFYRCLADKALFNALMNRLELTIHSKEEWEFCKSTWEDVSDPVERAARWYYALRYSFASLGRNFGRATRPNYVIAGLIRRQIDLLPAIHERFRDVQIENLDFRDILNDYCTPYSVAYIDPTYLGAHKGTYKHEMTVEDHIDLIDMVMHLPGFFAISGFAHPVYDGHAWDDIHVWKVFHTSKPMAFTDSNNKPVVEDHNQRESVLEHLWIKDNR